MSDYNAAVEELERLLEHLPPSARTDTPVHVSWKFEVVVALETIFGIESRMVREFGRLIEEIEKGPLWDRVEHVARKFLIKAIRLAKEKGTNDVEKDVTVSKWAEQPPRIERAVTQRKVFIVHGHDELTREKVARFLEKLGLEPIVLHEQPNQGRTIIEKFTQYSDVAFALVLLTPDDIGGTKLTSHDQLRSRARQNVIIEFGYFLGKLGRERVCALLGPGVELPSDYNGVLYIELDSVGGWRMKVAKEMKAAGLPIDMNSFL